MKKSTNMFMLVAILMHLLHTMRGSELTFIIDGSFPYVLYHGTMALYVVCLIFHVFNAVTRIRNKLKKV